MKKLILIYLILSSFPVLAMRVIGNIEIECKSYGWAELLISKSDVNNISQKYLVCVAPDSNYYFPLYLRQNHYEYQELIKQYSGQYPSFEQIEKAKEEIRKDGYIVD